MAPQSKAFFSFQDCLDFFFWGPYYPPAIFHIMPGYPKSHTDAVVIHGKPCTCLSRQGLTHCVTLSITLSSLISSTLVSFCCLWSRIFWKETQLQSFVLSQLHTLHSSLGRLLSFPKVPVNRNESWLFSSFMIWYKNLMQIFPILS